MAESACVVCRREIGYETPFYDKSDKGESRALVHQTCYLESTEAEPTPELRPSSEPQRSVAEFVRQTDAAIAAKKAADARGRYLSSPEFDALTAPVRAELDTFHRLLLTQLDVLDRLAAGLAAEAKSKGGAS